MANLESDDDTVCSYRWLHHGTPPPPFGFQSHLDSSIHATLRLLELGYPTRARGPLSRSDARLSPVQIPLTNATGLDAWPHSESPAAERVFSNPFSRPNGPRGGVIFAATDGFPRLTCPLRAHEIITSLGHIPLHRHASRSHANEASGHAMAWMALWVLRCG